MSMNEKVLFKKWSKVGENSEIAIKQFEEDIETYDLLLVKQTKDLKEVNYLLDLGSYKHLYTWKKKEERKLKVYLYNTAGLKRKAIAAEIKYEAAKKQGKVKVKEKKLAYDKAQTASDENKVNIDKCKKTIEYLIYLYDKRPMLKKEAKKLIEESRDIKKKLGEVIHDLAYEMQVVEPAKRISKMLTLRAEIDQYVAKHNKGITKFFNKCGKFFTILKKIGLVSKKLQIGVATLKTAKKIQKEITSCTAIIKKKNDSTATQFKITEKQFKSVNVNEAITRALVSKLKANLDKTVEEIKSKKSVKAMADLKAILIKEKPTVSLK